MGFVAGSSCLLHSPLYQLPIPSSSSSYKSRVKYGHTRSKFRAPMASCLRQDDPNEEDPFCKKRIFLFMGTAALPLLGLRNGTLAVDVGVTPEDNLKAETGPQMDRPSNSFLSLLNGIGIFSSAVLGAIYALSQKEKTTANATIETISCKLKEKEELIFTLKRNYDSKLLNEQEERAKHLGKAKEDQQALIDQLNSANGSISCLGQELKNEKKLMEELKLQINSLKTKLSKTDADKKDLEIKLKEKVDSNEILLERNNLLSLDLNDKQHVVQNLSSSLAEKELELRNLNSAYKQTKDDLSSVHFQIQGLKNELLRSQKELEAKNSLVDDLNSKVSALTLENDDSRSKYDVMEKEYNDLRLTSEKNAALDAKVLREKEEELHQLKDQFELALNEASRIQVIVTDLTHERENLMHSLENESKTVNNLKNELQITQENLRKSSNEVTQLEKHLHDSNKLRKEHEIEAMKLSSELTEVRESLQHSLDDAKLGAEMLASELTTAKEDLKKAQAELQGKSNELTASFENCDSLQRELIDIYKKAETTAEDLKEKKKLVASLNKDLQSLEKQVSNDRGVRKALEKDLEEATKSLDEMNRSAMIISSELEKANSVISSLESEKGMLYKSITEQRNASKEAQENIEDAHNFIMRLGKERENLENKAKKFEEELARAKGEILRLRSQINSSRAGVNDESLQKDEDESKVVNARKNIRRNKTGRPRI